MAIQTTPHTQPEKNADPAEDERDPNQLNDDGSTGSDAAMIADTETARSAGSRNERVTEFHGNKHNVEEFTSAHLESAAPAKDAPGVTNHTVAEEGAGQQKMTRGRADSSTDLDTHGNPIAAGDTIDSSNLPKRKAEQVEMVEVSAMRPIR